MACLSWNGWRRFGKTMMIVMPTDNPLFVDLNAYYLDVPKLIEHLQGQIGSGGLWFKSAAAEGAVFFDKDDLINAMMRTRDGVVLGTEAIAQLTAAGNRCNFNICVYRIGPAEVYFWAGIPVAEKIYKNLSAEFTDLGALVKKMGSERLTGYIDVLFDDGSRRGMIFLINGRVLGAAASWADAAACVTLNNQKEILQLAEKGAAAFNVCRIPVTGPHRRTDDGGPPESVSGETIAMLEEFLLLCETAIARKPSKDLDFNKLLKRKFVQKADIYAFLDPFAAEFEYDGRKIRFSGRATDQELSHGVIQSVLELIDERGLRKQSLKALGPWLERYGGVVDRLGLLG